MTRREFLKLSLMLAVGGLAMTAEVAGKFVERTIDFHAHAILPSYVDALKVLKIDAQTEEGFPLPKWSVENHFQFMDEAGIDFTILSWRRRIFPINRQYAK